ncbi:MAG: hypothetical protein CR972_04330 [Candidatus Moraniibacteriota bacterium]|nr:MAG: hypothetical protein CR972_04330 [Candidatus Moranbacteria bacterium]
MKITQKKNSKNIIVAVVFAVATFFYVFTGEDYFELFDRSQEVLQDTENKKNEGSLSAEGIYSVIHIVDGDTFDIENGERVRMIGIDTPERGEVYYKEAKEYLKILIHGKKVRLVKDVSERDRYGRLLRHVYVDDQWINKKMIRDGFARLVTYAPDVAHVADFTSAERAARKEHIGLWRNK